MYVGPLLCLRYVSKGEPPKARRKTVREYRQAHRTRPAFVAGQFVRAASIFVQPSSYPLPGPAPGCCPAIRKRDGAVPVEPQEAGRADASRSLYCCGGMLLCRFPSRCFRTGNDKLSGRTPRRQALFLPAGNFFLCYFPFFFGEEGKQRPWSSYSKNKKIRMFRTRTDRQCGPAPMQEKTIAT